MPHGMWDLSSPTGILVPRPGIEPIPPAMEVRSLNHWTSREVPRRRPTLVQDKLDFKTKCITRDKEEYFVMIKGLFHQEDISFLNVYEPNSRTSKHIKKNLTKLKGEIEKLTIIVGDFNIPSQKLIELDQHTPTHQKTRIWRI